MQFVSLARASRYLRRDTTDDDEDVQLLIEIASSLVLNYLGEQGLIYLDTDTGDVPLDSDEEPIGVPRAITGATLYLTGWLYRNRDQDDQKAFDNGYLPQPVIAMLYPLRDPAISQAGE